jgi:hypothetical protein
MDLYIYIYIYGFKQTRATVSRQLEFNWFIKYAAIWLTYTLQKTPSRKNVVENRPEQYFAAHIYIVPGC